MKRTEALGLVVVCAVLTGTYVARANHASSLIPSLPAATSDVANAPPPDVTHSDQTVSVGDVRLTLSITPRPVAALHPFTLRLRAESHGRPIGVDAAVATFAMEMPMGVHRVSLVRSQEWNEGTIELPLCFSGDTRWTIVVDARAAGQMVTARFHLDLERPAWSTE